LIVNEKWGVNQEWGGAYLSFLLGQEDRSVAIESSESSPGESEILFVGRLSAKDGDGRRIAANFRMRMVRNKLGEPWRIRFLHVTKSNEKESKTP
jgi:hypothetical protein